jgi:hypothetical protein
MSHGKKNYEICIFMESLVYKTSTTIQPCISWTSNMIGYLVYDTSAT